MVLEVDGSGLADLVVDGGLGDQAEDGEGVVGAVGGLGEGGLSAAAGLRRGGESVEEAFREELEGLRVPLHGDGGASLLARVYEFGKEGNGIGTEE